MSIRCNICSIEIGEEEVERHIGTQQHEDNKSRISASGVGAGRSVAAMWLESIS